MKNYKYMVIGNPAAHSLSPIMQNAAFEFYDEGAVYGARELTLEELPAFVEYAKASLSGFNVTAPYKKEIMQYCSVINEEAEAAESVNTVKIIAGKLYGYTTDGHGLLRALESDRNTDVYERKVAILGAGGAAGAIAQTLHGEGAKEIIIVNRTLKNAEILAEKVDGRAVALDDTDAVDAAFDSADLVINCTSLGLNRNDPSPLDQERLRHVRALFDTVYLPTELQRLARELNIPCANGRAMLLFQGAQAFEIWTGHVAPIVKMQMALYSAIKELGNE